MNRPISRLLVVRRVYSPKLMKRLPNVLYQRRFIMAGSGPQHSQFSLGHDIYVSTCVDPYFNLSLEDYLFRHSPQSSPLLLIYRDSPCVVIGRHQNPWTELNFKALRATGIPFLRRRSGGGTVYHDIGNTNFSIHLPRSSFNRHVTGAIVLRAIQSLGIDASLNERNDIVLGHLKMSDEPLLGRCSAYKIVNKRGYHHGTMLISTKLDTLGEVLRPPKKHINTKGVASVRSEVCNLQELSTSVTHEAFTKAMIAEFRREYGISTDVVTVHDAVHVRSLEYIRRGMAELSTWDWMYGQTPGFSQSLVGNFAWGNAAADIQSKHGIINNLTVSIRSPHVSAPNTAVIEHLCNKLYENKPYGSLHSVNLDFGKLGREFRAGDKPSAELYLRDIVMWLDNELGC